MACWLDRSTKEIGCLGKYVDILDSSHLVTTKDTESHCPPSSSSLLKSTTRESLLYSMQMLFHPLLFAFALTVFHGGEKLEWCIYTEGTVCIVYHPAGYVSISVSLINCLIHVQSWHRTEQISAPSFPVNLNVRSHCS